MRGHLRRGGHGSAVLGSAVILLLVNLLWHEPLARLTGGGALPFALLNVLPSTFAVAWLAAGARAPSEAVSTDTPRT